MPQWQWQVGAVQYAPPLGLRLEELEARAGNQSAAKALQVQSLTVQPDWLHLLRTRQWRADLLGNVAGGTISGRATLLREADHQAVDFSATVEALNLAAFSPFRQMLDREVRGILSGKVEGQFKRRNALPAELRATITITNGDIPLRKPVLQHEHLPFSELRVQLEQKGQSLELQEGTLQSPLGFGHYKGTVTLARPLSASSIAVQGMLQARPELYQHVRDQEALQALRLQTAQKPLAVSLSGTLADPALAFERAALPALLPEPGARDLPTLPTQPNRDARPGL